jgi:hypothetical protein
MDIVSLVVAVAFPLVPIFSVWAIVRYGPVPSRWRRREHPIGFALFIGAIAFAAGFFGPIVLTPDANQGPLLGIFITGPLGLLVGAVWGAVRAVKRAD